MLKENKKGLLVDSNNLDVLVLDGITEHNTADTTWYPSISENGAKNEELTETERLEGSDYTPSEIVKWNVPIDTDFNLEGRLVLENICDRRNWP